jgi:hypothetical protein
VEVWCRSFWTWWGLHQSIHAPLIFQFFALGIAALLSRPNLEAAARVIRQLGAREYDSLKEALVLPPNFIVLRHLSGILVARQPALAPRSSPIPRVTTETASTAAPT